MDLPQLCTVLQACLSTDQVQRTTAEGVLKQHETAGGQVVNLLRVAAEESVDAAVRQVASIAFKNLVRHSWEAVEGATPPSYQIPEEDRRITRENLLEGLIRSPHAVQVQLGEVFKTVVYSDYPQQWPGLLQLLTTNMASQEPQRVHGALYALRILTRKYEFRDEEDRAPLADIVNTTFPVLLHIFHQLLAAPALTPEVCTYIKLVCKTFWSATYMGVPDFLVNPGHFNGWMGALMQAVQQTLPEELQPVNKDDRPASAWWKSRKWLFHIVYRLLSRYGVTKHCKEGNDQAFSIMFVRECSATYLETMLAKVSAIATGAYISPRVVNLVFQYLSVAIGIKELYKLAAGHWDTILCNVAFPIMCFNEEDAELWANDPHEYVRKGYDILEDMYSPKTAVANFAHDLCKHKRSHLDKFMATMVAVLQQFGAIAASGGPVDPAVIRRADGALLAVGVMNDLLKDKKPYKTQLGGMLLNFVMPVFSSPYGHLRAKAVWVAGVYSDARFPEGQGTGASFNNLFAKVVTMLGDSQLPVRVDTVVALRQFIDTAEDTESLKPILPDLLGAIFNLMGEIDAEDLVFSLEALVEKFGADIAPYAVQMVGQLASAFARYTANENDAEDDDEEDMSGIAAYGCLRAINTLLESVSALGPELFPILEVALFPMIQKLISTEGQDMIEEILEMMAYLTYFGPGISPRMWTLWPQMHAMLMEWGIDYWDNLLPALDNMISRDTTTFLASQEPDFQASVFQMVQHSLMGDYSEKDIVAAARLLHVVLQVCRGHVDRWVEPYMKLAMLKLATTESAHLKDSLVCIVANAIYYNPILAIQVLSAAGAVQSFFSGWFAMIMVNRVKTGRMKHFRRIHDKKVVALALMSILALPEQALPQELAASSHLLLAGVVHVMSSMKEQEEMALAEAEEDEDDEGEEADEEEGPEEEADEDNEDGEEEDDEYMKKLQRRARALLGQESDNEDSDDQFFSEDEDVSTPIDSVEPYILLAEILAGMTTLAPSRHQTLAAHLAADEPMRTSLQALVAHAEEQRQQREKDLAAADK